MIHLYKKKINQHLRRFVNSLLIQTSEEMKKTRSHTSYMYSTKSTLFFNKWFEYCIYRRILSIRGCLHHVDSFWICEYLYTHHSYVYVCVCVCIWFICAVSKRNKTKNISSLILAGLFRIKNSVCAHMYVSVCVSTNRFENSR